MNKNILEFRMSGEPHCWIGLPDIREISVERIGTTNGILIKMDGTNNKSHKREQIQFHITPEFAKEFKSLFDVAFHDMVVQNGK